MSCNAANKSLFLYILLPFPVSFKKFCNYLKLLLTSLYKFVRGSKRAHKGRALYLKGPVKNGKKHFETSCTLYQY